MPRENYVFHHADDKLAQMIFAYKDKVEHIKLNTYLSLNNSSIHIIQLMVMH